MAITFTFAQYVEHLRTYLKDSGLKNIILKHKQENAQSELELYTRMGITNMNMIPPSFILIYDETTISNCPNVSLVIMESTWHALVSNNILQARNDLAYSNGGITLKVEDAQRYLPTIQALWQNLLQSREHWRMYKKSVNIGSILGTGGYSGTSSPYADLYRGYYVTTF